MSEATLSETKLENRIYRAVVVRTERLTEGMMRIVLGGPDLETFISTGVGDEYIRLFLPERGQSVPVYPHPEGDYWEYTEDQVAGPMRTYTIRSVDEAAGEIGVDFVVHPGGIAADWALAVQAGSEVGFNTPTGLYELPADAGWQVLLADATGLPAAARLLENTPEGLHTTAILEVAGPAHEQPLELGDRTQVRWLHGGNGNSPSRLAEVLRGMDLPDGPGYIWVAGEARVTREARKYLRRERMLPVTSFKVVGYWTDKSEEWNERYEALGDDFKKWLEELWSTDKDPETIQDEVADAFDAHGL
ncbi:siderophore-interacting protein [Paeniglutamicibacter sp. R2-26]|uniref:siderophore-interacting protein n=1 Tax=Paeniglutamicibacter sp. R2-26 TaxID=3144417 RepID=UPI003EE809DE